MTRPRKPGWATAWLFPCLVFAFAAMAQRYPTRIYEEPDGLPSSQVYAAKQDDRGRMWFSTRNGIGVFDGASWRSFSSLDQARRSTAIHRWGEDGDLYSIRVDDVGKAFVYSFDTRGYEWSTLQAPSFAVDTIVDAAFVSRTFFALVSRDGQLHVYSDNRWSSFELGATSVTIEPAGLLIGTGTGIWRIGSEASPDPVRLYETSAPVWQLADVGGDGTQIAAIVGNTYVEARHGKLETIQILPADIDRWKGVVLDARGWAIAYSTNHVFLIADGFIERLGQKSGLANEGAEHVFIDREGNTWIVSTRGVTQVSSFRLAGFQTEHGLLENEVTSIIVDGQTVVLGHPEGFSFMQLSSGSITDTLRIAENSNIRVMDMAKSPDGAIFAAVERSGLWRLENRTLSLVHQKGHMQGMLVRGNGDALFSSADSVFRAQPGRVPDRVHVSDYLVRKLFEFDQDSLFLTTSEGGLWSVDDAGHVQQYVGQVSGSNSTYTMARYGGAILVGTAAGLFELTGGSLQPAALSVAGPVYLLFTDAEKYLWIGTDNGVLRWDGTTVVRLTVKDGLIGRETNRDAGAVLSTGDVLIGTSRGLSRYRPRFDTAPDVAPIAAITTLDADGELFKVSETVILPPGFDDLIFGFDLATFVDESDLRVQTMLDGLEDEWTDVAGLRERTVRYTNVPAGKYRLLLRAGTRPGKWSTPVISGMIRIRAPFWQKPWFFGLIAFLTVSTIYLVVRSIQQRRYARLLEQEVARRVAENERYHEGFDRARWLEALGTFAGGIAHDFNNLLTIVLGNIGLVKHDLSRTSESHYFLEIAESAVDKAQRLTAQLLTFSRGGAPRLEEAYLNELIHEVVSLGLSGSKVRADIDLGDLRPVQIDVAQMTQVFSNLVINAAEAMPDGGTLIIRGRNMEHATDQDGQPQVEITVADEGPGIPPEVRDRIFDPYFSTKQRGSGLGLSTAFSIVGRHNGQLSLLDSEKGSIFCLRLPALLEAEKSSGHQQAPEAPTTALQGRILVMDDDDAVRFVATRALKSIGLQVDQAVDGQEAIDRHRQALENDSPYDLVLLDLTVQDGIGGAEALQELQQRQPNVTAVVVSGYAENPVMAEHERYGFVASLAKPFSVAELQGVVARLLRPSER